jgi:MSHA pilin protein MshD
LSAEAEQRGVTLFELVLAIAVLSVALVGVMMTFSTTARGSGDAMVRQQAQLAAQAYLEEILLKKFYDPDTNSVCPAKEGARSEFDNVCDYDGLSDTPPKNQLGGSTGLSADYTASVTVTRDATVDLNGLTNTISGPPNDVIRVLRVDVTVTGPGGTSVKLTGYRTNYNCNALADSGCKQL